MIPAAKSAEHRDEGEEHPRAICESQRHHRATRTSGPQDELRPHRGRRLPERIVYHEVPGRIVDREVLSTTKMNHCRKVTRSESLSALVFRRQIGTRRNEPQRRNSFRLCSGPGSLDA